MKFKYAFTIIALGSIVFVLATRVSVKAISESDFSRYLKQQFSVAHPIKYEDALTSRIGIFPPGFGSDAASALENYQKVYGVDGVQLISYDGYSIVLPNSLADQMKGVYAQIDTDISTATQHTPSAGE